MKAMSKNAILFNLAGGAIVLTVLGYIGQSVFLTDANPPCSQRFPAGQQFALEDANGKPMSSDTMQAQLGWRQWGVVENARIVKARVGDAEQKQSVLKVNLNTAVDQRSGADRSGVGFLWAIPDMEKAHAACLSYSVYMPSKFEFLKSGHLPGLVGKDAFDENGDDRDKKDPGGFTARVAWSSSGEVMTDVMDAGADRLSIGSQRVALWPRGRWVRVEQEVVLNAPGKADGATRLWLDGQLMAENTAVKFRNDAAVGFEGVVGDIGYPRSTGTAAMFGITPMVAQWR